MVWIAAFGVVLQVAGLIIAIRGVGKTYRETQPATLWPDVLRAAQSWFQRVVLGRKEDKPTVVIVPDNLTITSTVHGELRIGPPSDDASPAEWIRYLNRRLDQVDERVVDARKYAEEVATSAETRVVKRLSELGERVRRIDAVASAAHTAAIGRDGAGLRETAVGLAITAVGVLLTITGLPWEAEQALSGMFSV